MKAKREAETSATPGGTAAKAGGKADPKKDAKGGAAKGGKGGAPGVEDKNSPQPITVEYQELDPEVNYIIFERKYNAKDPEKKSVAKATTPGAKVVAATIQDTEGLWKDLPKDKVKERTKELVTKYRIVRSNPYSLVIKLKLNKEEEKLVERTETPVSASNDDKGKAPAGKKK